MTPIKDAIKGQIVVVLNDNTTNDISPKDARDAHDFILNALTNLLREDFVNTPLLNIHISDGAITTSKVSDTAITEQKLASSSVGSTKLKANGVKTDNIQDLNITRPKLSQAIQDALDAVGGGTIVNNPDDEDLETVGSVLKFKDRDSAGTQLGYKIIRQNFDFQNIPASYANSIWEVRYEHDLGGLDFVIPANVTLLFCGGTIANHGVITGDNTRIEKTSNQVFDTSGTFAGTWTDIELSPLNFGAVGDGSTIQDTEMTVWAAACNAMKAKVDLSDKHYVISSELNFPKYGGVKGGKISGANCLCFGSYEAEYMGTYEFDSLTISYSYYAVWDRIIIRVGRVVINGGDGDASQGTFWNQFRNIKGWVELNADLHSVNQNLFEFVRGGLLISGGYEGNPIPQEVDMNRFLMIDTTSADFTDPSDGSTGWHILNTSYLNQRNIIESWYGEGSGKRAIRGRFHVSSNYIDSTNSPYSLPATMHVLETPDHSTRNRNDFFAGNPKMNCAEGGLWDVLNMDDVGQPICYSSNAGATVQATTQDPTGHKFMYATTTALSFKYFNISIKNSISGRIGLFIWVYADNGVAAFESQRDGSPFNISADVYHDAGNGWMLYRLSFAARDDGESETIRAYINTSGTELRTVGLGLCWASIDKTCFLPSKVHDNDISGVCGSSFPSDAIALPIGAFIKNTDSSNSSIYGWIKKDNGLSCVTAMNGFTNTFTRALTIQDNTPTTILTINESVYTEGAVAVIELVWSNPSDTPDFIGGAGYQKILLGMNPNGDTGVKHYSLSISDEVFITSDGTSSAPSISVDVTSGSYEVKATTPNGIGDSSVKATVKINNNGFNL